MKNLMMDNVIRLSNSPYNSSVWISPKKPNIQSSKRWRMAIDFCSLNEKTIKDTYSLLNITEILDQKAQNILAYSIRVRISSNTNA